MTSSTDGPDQGDPAAWPQSGDDVLYNGTYGVVVGRSVVNDQPVAQVWFGETSGDPMNVHVDALRAPGAVAAAPPGDEDAVTHTRGLDATDPLHRARILAAGLARWQIDGPAVPAVVTVAGQIVAALNTVLAAAPPAGHEDVAAAPPGDDPLAHLHEVDRPALDLWVVYGPHGEVVHASHAGPDAYYLEPGETVARYVRQNAEETR